MSEKQVSGLVLTVGEPTTKRAVNALKAQSYQCEEIVMVENISPFHRAMNDGISRISTEFFLQCDADMIPDPDCIEVLLNHISSDTGVAIGHLQDPLMGKIQAIKLFRTECARDIQFADQVSPDTHYISCLLGKGFHYVFASRSEAYNSHGTDIFGVHDPDYSELYTFQKYRLEGARMVERGNFQELIDSLDRLGKSGHPMSKIAILGLSKGIFEVREGDGLSQYQPDEAFKKLEKYMNGTPRSDHIFAARA